MTSPRWELLTKIFEDALEKPQNARTDFVRQECKGDTGLEAEVIKLLEADQRAGSFLERPAFDTVSGQSIITQTLPPLSAGSVLSGRFEILLFIGQGGMGQVYEALDLELKSRVALKAIRPDISSDPHMLSRFRREVQLTRRVTHPNVCRTFDIERHSSIAPDGTSSDLTFLTMELLQGETLADLLRRQGRLTAAEAQPLVLQMIEALSAAHAAGIVHRDFKPSNVLLVPSSAALPANSHAPAGLRVVVTDFGLARALFSDARPSADQASASLTGNQALMGTLIYMAPEQFERGEATAASDIYSLGLVMYEVVTGQRPFEDAIPFAEAAKRLKHPAPSPVLLAPDLDPAWEAAISKCLEREPENRFQSARDLAEEIAPGNASTFRSTSHREGLKRAHPALTARPERRRSWQTWAAAIAILAAIVALFFLGSRYYQLRRDAKLAGGATVLLTEIQNSTGDQRFDGTTELIRHQLSQSPYFNLMDASRIREVLTQMTKPPNAPLDPPTAREVALRTGAPRVIFGAVSRVGDSYVLDVDIEQPDNNPRRSRAQWENHWTWNMSLASSDKEIPNAFLTAVRDGSDWIRSQVGESANDIAREDVPPEDVTTANWKALAEFTQAEKFRAARNNEATVVALRNSVAADPKFALGYARLGDVLVSLSQFTEGYRAYDSALAMDQQRLTRRERDRIRGIYAMDSRDYATSEAMFREYVAYYPHDYLGWFYRATPLMMMGRLEEAIESLKKAAAIEPAKMFAPSHIARFDLILGDFDEAAKWIQRLRDMGHSDDADLDEGQADFLQGHYQDSLSHFTRLKDSKDPLYRSRASSLLTRLYAEQGLYQNALSEIEQGIAVDRSVGDKALEADKTLDRAYISYKLGQYDACLRDTRSALTLDRSLPRCLSAATLLGQAAYEAKPAIKGRIAVQLRSVEALITPGGLKPISDIVRAHVHGEVLLAEDQWELALTEFRRADHLEVPMDDKEYLGRALLVAARHASDEKSASRLRKEGLSARSAFAREPGLVWQWAQAYPPGYVRASQPASFAHSWEGHQK